jgi:hypothetical protein
MPILVTKFSMSLKLNCCPLGFGAGYFIQPKTALLKEKFFLQKLVRPKMAWIAFGSFFKWLTSPKAYLSFILRKVFFRKVDVLKACLTFGNFF